MKLIQEHPNWSEAVIQRRGGKEYKRRYKNRWEEEVRKGGTVFEKLQFIDRQTYERFTEARRSLLTVRDGHLRGWALQAAQTFMDPTFTFTASQSWINAFKIRHSISSRKITRVVSHSEIRSPDFILQKAKSFQAAVKKSSQSFKPENVLNTDQTGFTYEILSGRTLSHKGEKITLGASKSPKNLATHSYTIQYVINLAGEIVGDVFMCLQETSGKLGRRVEEDMFPACNVTLTCSKSGKLTTSLYEYFLDKVVVPSMKEDFLFVVDSWGGQTNPSIYSDRFGVDGSPRCTVELIPPKCTSMCQPLDTTFHRQLKFFAAKIANEAAFQSAAGIHRNDEITTRNNCIKLQSILRNQFGAPVFKPMIKYSWFSAGLSEDKPLFQSVKEACFTFEKTDSIKCEQNCGENRFVKCAICRKILCYNCFFHDYHFHFQ